MEESKVNSSGERWYKVNHNGVEHWESETFRRERARDRQEKEDRKLSRQSLGIREEDIHENADALMAMLEECYTFGDPDFSPDVVYRTASRQFGFEPDYVGRLINDLVRRGLVIFEYIRDPSVHPKDILDRWQLHRLPPSESSTTE